jgi:hypothetical protein
MTKRKAPLKPSRQVRREDLAGATRRAREFAERLAADGRTFPDSTEIVRADRDSRV